MKKIMGLLFLFVTLLLIPILSLAQGIEERDLPLEKAPPRTDKEFQELRKDSIVFNGYINQTEVTVIPNAEVMGAVYYLCREKKEDLCADEQGVLFISGADSGHQVELIKKLDDAALNQTLLQFYLTHEKEYGGARRIIDINNSF